MKIKEWFKSKKVSMFTIITSAVLFSAITVGAATLIAANEVSLSSSKTSKTNVQDALDELYDKVEDANICSNARVAAPKIADGLVPVIIADDGTVKVVSQDDPSWYNYCNKVWANAVILSSGSYTVGQTIPESAIESYLVWIPKYKYQLWNINQTAEQKAHSINIVFDTTNTTDVEGESCATPLTSGGTGNCNNGEYMTHPAFITMNVDGFWVGKFEVGYKGATSVSGAEVNANDSTKIIVKPNSYSWRSNTVMNMFLSAYNYKRNLNSHMMKNTEWGAVAYLSHSRYGIDNEVNINNNSSYKTGYSSLLTIQQGTYPGTYGDGAEYNKAYNTSLGNLASTTGNISGIYDMSGGAHEYMASYSAVGSSGFTTTTIAQYDSKYFDVYNTNSGEQTYQYRILGDATGEMGPFVDYKDGDSYNRHHNQWYGDFSDFVQSSYPWFSRGGYYDDGVLAGQFDFSRYTGGVGSTIGSRLVLAP